MHRRAPHLVLLSLLLAAAPLPADEPAKNFFFKKGDRVVFLGDSITEQYQYSTYIELYLLTRFPGWDIQCLNAGIGGDTAWGGVNRFAELVLAEKPTCVTIDFGMNDGGYGNFNAASAASFIKNTEGMLEAAKKAGVRVALISPNAVEVAVNPGLKTYLETQKKFYAPLKEVAAKFQVPFVDQYAVTRAVLDKIAAAKAAVHPFPDAVHTNEAGGLLMAHTILVGLHAPGVVSDVEIDAAAKKSMADNCTVDDLAVSSDVVSFTRKDGALPLPVLKEWRPLLPYMDSRLDHLNYYGLKVTGLKGNQALTIDGKEVGTYSAKELALGVNLGNLDKGPLFEQGMKVLGAIKARNDVVHSRFRQVVMYSVEQTPEWLRDAAKERKPGELRKRKEKIDAMQADIVKLTQPAAHHFELKPVK